jgi:Transcription elongation factor, GreA/GreB, C-term
MHMNAQDDLIVVGCEVEVDLLDISGNKERLRFLIVPDTAADFAQGYLGENTPLAQALLGERVGHTIPYIKNDILGIEILAVTKSSNQPTDDIAEKRAAKMKKALRAVEDTNAMVFASSFSGKWGDYDPDSIPKDKEQKGSE